MKTRASGILLHITSLPSEYGIGDLGPCAYKFADFLSQAGQSYWQVLPINQIDSQGSFSPYNCLSAFAGNTLLISPELLIREGLLTGKDVQDRPLFSKTKVDYRRVKSFKERLLRIAYERFKKIAAQKMQYRKFCSDSRDWLADYALFMAIRQNFRPGLWSAWQRQLRDRKADALEDVKMKLADSINREKFQQYIFFKQWFDLRNYCNAHGIRLIGDIPIYVLHDSADVWAYPEFFKLTKTKEPRFAGGVPPDFFSRTGQLWGNPVYDWKALKQTDYRWWLRRIGHNLSLFDIVRIDHFRGFVGYWQVPAGSKTAKKGKWVRGPKEHFLNKLFERFPSSRFIAEDLGYITDEVNFLIEKFRLTRMKILMFGFNRDASKNPHHPCNYVENSVVYTGTHDNNTVKGWFENETDAAQRKRLFDYIGHGVSTGRIHWEFIKMAMRAVSDIAIIPLQDVLGLGQQARMNRPAAVKNNWRWRLAPQQMRPAIFKKLAKMTEDYGRY